MIRVGIETLVMTNLPGACIVVLRPFAKEKFHSHTLPICIGPVESAAIAKAVSGDSSTRPMTHSLLLTVMGTLGGKLSHILIGKVQGTIFYATLFIEQGDQIIKIDARPSDAIALAVRKKVPMYVSEEVMESAGFPSWINAKNEQDKAELEEFQAFLENLTPDDFLVE